MEKYEIQRLRDLPIEEVAEQLGMSVAHHKALCPFHDDYHASLSFCRAKNTCKCFVCMDKSLGTIDLVMRLRHVDFLVACHWLADKFGIALEGRKPAWAYSGKPPKSSPNGMTAGRLYPANEGSSNELTAGNSNELTAGQSNELTAGRLNELATGRNAQATTMKAGQSIEMKNELTAEMSNEQTAEMLDAKSIGMQGAGRIGTEGGYLAKTGADAESKASTFDASRYARFFEHPWLSDAARRFLFDERGIDPRVVRWCRLTSWQDREGTHWLQTPYFDQQGRLIGLQNRNLDYRKNPLEEHAVGNGKFQHREGHEGEQLGNSCEVHEGDKQGKSCDGHEGTQLGKSCEALEGDKQGISCEKKEIATNSAEKEEARTKPRFRFPRGAKCTIYNLPVLNRLREGDELYITEGCSDCWAMLSAGHKAIAIPSATLLSPEDKQLLVEIGERLHLSWHMYPDKDAPGERLFMQLREILPDIVHHQLPPGCKDFSDYYRMGIAHPNNFNNNF